MQFSLKMPLLCGLLALFILTVFSASLYAQGPIKRANESPHAGTMYDEEGVPFSSKYFPIKPAKSVISLVRLPGLQKDQFALRIGHENVVTGCVDISNYGYEAKYLGPALEIEIDRGMFDMRNQPQYAHLKCGSGNKLKHIDIVLDKKTLTENGTNKIRFRNLGAINIYHVSLYDDRVVLQPDENSILRSPRFVPHNIHSRHSSLLYWFYPENTVLLWSPQADDIDVSTEIASFAGEHGLKPMTDIYPNFTSPLRSDDYHYYVAEADSASDAFETVDGGAVGHIFKDVEVYGLEGPETERQKLSVHAKKPGLYE